MMNQSDIPFCVVYVIDIQVDMLSYQDIKFFAYSLLFR